MLAEAQVQIVQDQTQLQLEVLAHNDQVLVKTEVRPIIIEAQTLLTGRAITEVRLQHNKDLQVAHLRQVAVDLVQDLAHRPPEAVLLAEVTTVVLLHQEVPAAVAQVIQEEVDPGHQVVLAVLAEAHRVVQEVVVKN